MSAQRELPVNQIINGDSLDVMNGFPSGSIDLIVTSPPYADTVSYGGSVQVFKTDDYVNWLLKIVLEAERCLKPTGSFILNINDKIVNGERSTYVFELIYRSIKETKMKLFDRYIWFKKSTLPVGGERRLNDRVEYIFHFVKDSKNFKSNIDRVREPYAEVSLRRFRNKVHGNDIVSSDGVTSLSQRGGCKPHPLGMKPTTVFRFDTGSALRGLEHPAPFHPQLPIFFIKWLTDENDTVLDPFMGSGTTAVACMILRRRWVGIEISKEYCESIKRWVEPLMAQTVLNTVTS